MEDGRYLYAPKEGISFTVTAEELVRRLVALVPPSSTKSTSKSRPRLDWATLHQHTFGTDVLQCPTCGGKRRIRALFSSWAKA